MEKLIMPWSSDALYDKAGTRFYFGWKRYDNMEDLLVCEDLLRVQCVIYVANIWAETVISVMLIANSEIIGTLYESEPKLCSI